LNKPIVIIALVLAFLLAGCQSNPTFRDASGKEEISLDTSKYDNSPANVYIRLSIAYLNEGETNTALAYANKAVEKDSGNPNAYNVRGLIYQQVGQYSRAESNYRKALSIAPNEPYINNTYGRYLCELKQYDKALIHFNKTIDHPLYKEKWIPMTNLGICALRQNNLEVAQENFRKALQSNGKFKIALYNMIQVSVLQENYWSARAYLQRYLEVGEHNAKTLWWGIQTEKVLGDLDRLDSYKLQLRVKFPDSDEAKMLMAENKQL